MPPDDAPQFRRQADNPGRGRSSRRRWVAGIVVLAWGTLMIVPPLYLVANRTAWLTSLEAPETQENWEEFRSAMRAESGLEGPVGPVLRKIPKSAEPPIRVWLRDYLALAIIAWVVLGGTLGGFLGMMIVGASGESDLKKDRLPPEG